MAQLEYGDYYKFVASAGIALLAAAVVLPWMFLREPFDLGIEATKIEQLSPEAQKIIHERQHLLVLAITAIPWVSSGMGLLGLLMTSLGLVNWRARQTIRDKSEELEVEKLGRELEQMSPAEVQAKVQEELENVEEQPIAFEAPGVHSPVNAYLAVESKLLARIRACYGSSANVLSNQRLAAVEYDAIISGKDAEHVILEIKYIRKGFRQGWLAESASNLVAKTALYLKTFSGDVRGVLLIVLGDSSGPISQKAVAQFEQLRHVQPSRFKNVQVHTIDEHQIETISCAKLKAVLS